MLFALEHADWLGAIVSVVRAGAGADCSPRALVGGIHACPEVDLARGATDEDDELVETAFEIVSMPWLAIGAIDADRRLTALGVWAMPRALARAWNADFDRAA